MCFARHFHETACFGLFQIQLFTGGSVLSCAKQLKLNHKNSKYTIPVKTYSNILNVYKEFSSAHQAWIIWSKIEQKQ